MLKSFRRADESKTISIQRPASLDRFIDRHSISLALRRFFPSFFAFANFTSAEFSILDFLRSARNHVIAVVVIKGFSARLQQGRVDISGV